MVATELSSNKAARLRQPGRDVERIGRIWFNSPPVFLSGGISRAREGNWKRKDWIDFHSRCSRPFNPYSPLPSPDVLIARLQIASMSRFLRRGRRINFLGSLITIALISYFEFLTFLTRIRIFRREKSLSLSLYNSIYLTCIDFLNWVF